MKKFQMTIMTLLGVVVGLILYVGNVQDEGVLEEVLGEKIENSSVEVTFLDIGQGDATFIEFSDGQQMLVDCAEDARVIEALGRVMEFFDKTIDYLVVSHPDSDHYGGCIDVLKRFEVRNIVYTGYDKGNDMYGEFLDAIDDEIDLGATYIQIHSEEVWNIASSTVQFLYPDHDITRDASIPGSDKIDSNDTSIAMKLSRGDSDVLMLGDASENLEEYLLSTYGEQLDVEVLKVAHHGSGSSSHQEFLDLVDPDYAVISAGRNNRYGHPSLRVLKRLERLESKVLRTDLRGDILIVLDNNDIYVQEH